MLLGVLGASLLGNMLAGKGVITAGEGTARISYESERSYLKKYFDSTTSFNKQGNNLTDFTNLFSPIVLKKKKNDDDIILNYFLTNL